MCSMSVCTVYFPRQIIKDNIFIKEIYTHKISFLILLTNSFGKDPF